MTTETPSRTILFSVVIGLLAALVAVMFLGPRLATKVDVDAAVTHHTETAPHRDLQTKINDLEQRLQRHIDAQNVDTQWNRQALLQLLEYQKQPPVPPAHQQGAMKPRKTSTTRPATQK